MADSGECFWSCGCHLLGQASGCGALLCHVEKAFSASFSELQDGHISASLSAWLGALMDSSTSTFPKQPRDLPLEPAPLLYSPSGNRATVHLVAPATLYPKQSVFILPSEYVCNLSISLHLHCTIPGPAPRVLTW